MPDSHGKFVWYELMTSDAKAAEDFYGKVVGWRAKDAGMPDTAYTIFQAGELPVGGLMALPENAVAAGAKPGWCGYVAVESVDATAEQAVREGGRLRHAPTDIPGIGRFAVLADPQGAVLALFKGSGAPPAKTAEPGSPGQAGWRELYAADWEAAFAFYAKLFGWRKADALDMGPMGTYQLYALGEETLGGMMTKPEAMPMPFWLYYFCVEEITAALARVEAAGGKLLHGPQEVPGGVWIIQCLDPQGAIFALVGPKG